jgi:hypothetical protein
MTDLFALHDELIQTLGSDIPDYVRIEWAQTIREAAVAQRRAAETLRGLPRVESAPVRRVGLRLVEKTL